MKWIKKYRLEVLCAIGCLMISSLMSFVTQGSEGEWYLMLRKPSFHPPAYVFAPVWTVLYLCMGAAFGRLLKTWRQHQDLILLFEVQFALNMIWTPLFFGLNRIDLALIDLSALWLVVMCFMYKSRGNRWVAGLFLPYFLWLSFALVLNFNLYILNSG